MSRSIWRWAVAAVFVMAAFVRGETKTRNVILVTMDGLRWQEVFTGAEEALLTKDTGGVHDVDAVRKDFWRPTPEERRETLMPFLWGVVAKEGQVFGNRAKGSVAHVTNDKWFSYPGYNEILTGFADPAIDSNDKIENKNVTVLEWLNHRPGFERKVAAFAGWDVMAWIVNQKRCGFPVMAGPGPVPEDHPNERQQLLNDLMAHITPSYEGEIYDPFVFQAAAEHVRLHKPRVLYVGFGETDTWAHAGRYDRVLLAAHNADDYVRRLWDLVQSMPEYRDKTSLVLVTDHGRGSGPVQWKSHARNVPGSSGIWIAVMGPDTPNLGERAEGTPDVTQSQVAATIAKLLGEDYRKDVPRAGQVIESAVGPGK